MITVNGNATITTITAASKYPNNCNATPINSNKNFKTIKEITKAKIKAPMLLRVSFCPIFTF